MTIQSARHTIKSYRYSLMVINHWSCPLDYDQTATQIRTILGSMFIISLKIRSAVCLAFSWGSCENLRAKVLCHPGLSHLKSRKNVCFRRENETINPSRQFWAEAKSDRSVWRETCRWFDIVGWFEPYPKSTIQKHDLRGKGRKLHSEFS